MPTPSKPVSVLLNEKNSHRTKEELKNRKKAEEALLSGRKLKESSQVKGNIVAHEEFLRVNKLLKLIGKNDGLYESSINRYCLLTAECEAFENMRTRMESQIDELADRRDKFEYPEYIRMQDNLQRNLINIDKQIQSKRKMLFDIEKENVMTIASSLRSIPKKAEKNRNPLKDALGID